MRTRDVYHILFQVNRGVDHAHAHRIVAQTVTLDVVRIALHGPSTWSRGLWLT